MKKRFSHLFTLTAIFGWAMVFTSCSDMEKEFEPELIKYKQISVSDFSPKEGKAGQEVTITGQDFGEHPNAATVFFDGVPADTILSLENTKIVTRVPNEGTTGIITVKVWTHTDSTDAAFVVLPSGRITGITPAEGSSGDRITISGENFGTNADEVHVLFREGVEAEIISVEETKIVAIVPEGGITGPITLNLGSQVLMGPVFIYPINSIEYNFNSPGDAQGWVTSHNSVTEVDFDVMKVSYDMSATKRRADLSHPDGMSVHAGVYPIMAIKMIDKPASGNFIFDTNLGQYKNGSNNWEGVLDDNVYYYDLRNSFGDGNTLSQTEETTFTTFQWKIADVTTEEKGYFVDWVKSFNSVEELEEYVAALNVGQNHYGFTGPERTVTLNDMDDWIGRDNQPGTTTIIDDGYAKVSFTPSDGATKARADFNFSQGGNWGTVAKEPWHFHPDFPIYALKIHFVKADGTLGGPRPETGTVKYDRLGEFDNTYADSHNVLWVDARNWSAAEKIEGSWWAVVVADILSEEQGYWVDWHRAFRSVEEMEFYLN